MNRADLLISVLMPLRGDARIVREVVKETSGVLQDQFTHHEIVLVVDGMDTETLREASAVLKEVPCVRIIQLTRDFGRETAALAGLETAIGDYVVILTPETDPPALIPGMVASCREEGGMVNGVDARGSRNGPVMSLLKGLFHRGMRRFLKVELLPNATEFRVLSRRMVNAITQYRESHRQLRLLASTVGYQRRGFSYTPLSRTGRDMRKGVMEELQDALDMIVAHSRQPLRFVSLLGWFAGFLNVLYVLYAALIYLFKDDVAPGWTTLSVQHGVMFFFVFTLLSILSEYVGRILEESRGRPLYLVADEQNSEVLNPAPEKPNVVHESP
ncbi:MAG: glycosyltransferase [Verrucomicrobiaceae bacterium]|nr:glycosyltransferase [Verrucomicrobiaceae bacterium]